MIKKTKTPWPTKAVMNQIYAQHLWGGKDVDFYSGEGSHLDDIIEPYLSEVIAFLNAHGNKLTVSDLGCGDFNIGKHLMPFTSKYIAMDIADQLIERNKSLFNETHLEFRCLDISKDNLPKTEVAILRQVLQHLSNAEIKRIVSKLQYYNYICLTEHLPSGSFTPNMDIIAGQGTRLKYNSGVDLLANPFNLKIKDQKVLSKIALAHHKGDIVTTLYSL